MGYYVQKPIVIQAVRFGETDFEEKPNWLINEFNKRTWEYRYDWERRPNGFIISTLEATILGAKGDYIVLGAKGELYHCRGDVFDETYEKVEMV